MKILLASAAVAALALAAAPAAAQVNGIAIAEPTIAIASAQARQTADAQIGTTFQAQRTQLEQLQQQRATIARQFDTDNNGELSEAEQTAAQSNTAVLQQLQTVEQQIAQTQQPITAARVYVIEQILLQFNAALQQVVQAGNIQLILTPASAVFAADTVDVTDDLVAALNQRVPTVSTTVPEGWRPQQASVQMFQEVQQILLAAAQQQAAQQQAAGANPAPAQQPVEGR
jgi:Skp family chaperone for outer membrane proteins